MGNNPKLAWSSSMAKLSPRSGFSSKRFQISLRQSRFSTLRSGHPSTGISGLPTGEGKCVWRRSFNLASWSLERNFAISWLKAAGIPWYDDTVRAALLDSSISSYSVPVISKFSRRSWFVGPVPRSSTGASWQGLTMPLHWELLSVVSLSIFITRFLID